MHLNLHKKFSILQQGCHFKTNPLQMECNFSTLLDWILQISSGLKQWVKDLLGESVGVSWRSCLRPSRVLDLCIDLWRRGWNHCRESYWILSAQALWCSGHGSSRLPAHTVGNIGKCSLLESTLGSAVVIPSFLNLCKFGEKKIHWYTSSLHILAWCLQKKELDEIFWMISIHSLTGSTGTEPGFSLGLFLNFCHQKCLVLFPLFS